MNETHLESTGNLSSKNFVAQCCHFHQVVGRGLSLTHKQLACQELRKGSVL